MLSYLFNLETSSGLQTTRVIAGAALRQRESSVTKQHTILVKKVLATMQIFFNGVNEYSGMRIGL